RERPQRAQIARRQIEDLAVDCGRALRSAERLLLENGPLREHGDAAGAFAAVGAMAEEPTEIVSTIRGGAQQPIEGGARLLVVGVVVDEVAVRADRVLRAPGLRRRDLGELHAEVATLVGGRGPRVETRLERGDEPLPVAARARPLLDLAERRR